MTVRNPFAATTWEFQYRAYIFALLASLAFALYLVDRQNVTVALANTMQLRFSVDGYWTALALSLGAALLVSISALLRTWASAYLRSEIVYGSEINSATLVADGPYRFVRNPLYLANVFMALGMGMLMSRAGLVFNVFAMIVFCYRLILREEAELLAAQPTHFTAYLLAVPRLLPSLTPRIPSSGQPPRWKAGFKAESWYWAFALMPALFALSLHR